jgi:HPt (histidine-containing phosphotransfer) domain-containing protein
VRDPRIPIAAMTAHAKIEDCERFLEAGMDTCLPKPLTRIGLQRFLECSLGRQGEQVRENAAPLLLLDRDKALKQVGGEAELLNGLYPIFLRDAPKYLEAARAALKEKDRPAMRNHLLSLKGSAAIIGATRLLQAAQTLHQAASIAKPDVLDARLDALERILEDTLAAVRALCGDG